MFAALLTIAPVVSAASTRSGVNWRSASRLGARLSGPGLSRQMAHRRSNPITCAAADGGTAGDCEDGDCGVWVPTAAAPESTEGKQRQRELFRHSLPITWPVALDGFL